jgi:hypothetical protein
MKKQEIMTGDTPAIAKPLDISIVQQKTADFQFKMRALANALKDAAPYLQFLEPERFYTQFYIDRAALARLNEIAAQDEFSNFGVFFGLEDPETQQPLSDPKAPGFGRLTCSFLGLDEHYRVLRTHFPVDAQPAQFQAEETWPPPPPPPPHTGIEWVFNLTHETSEVFAYFNQVAEPCEAAV